MDVYFCLIHQSGVTTPELVVLEAANLNEAQVGVQAVAADCPIFERLELYRSSELIMSLGAKSFSGSIAA